MSYDPRRRRKDPGFRSRAARVMRLAHKSGISLKRVYRGPRGGFAWVGPKKRRYNPMARKHRRARRHDPLHVGGRGMLGKFISGVVFAASAVVGKNAAGFVNSAVPQATVNIPGTNKGINLVSFFAGAGLAGFGPNAGLAGEVVDGFAGGLAGGSDPVASALGGGAMRNMGMGYPYGSIGV